MSKDSVAIVDFEVGDVEEKLTAVKLNGKIGAVNAKGEEIIPVKYDDILFNYDRSLTAVKLDGRWSVVDENGKAINDINYDEVNEAHINKALVVEKNDKWGLINTKENLETQRQSILIQNLLKFLMI